MKNINNAKLHRDNSDLNIHESSRSAASNQPTPSQPNQNPDKHQKNTPNQPMDDKKIISAVQKPAPIQNPVKTPLQTPDKKNNPTKKSAIFAQNQKPQDKPGQPPFEEPINSPPKKPIQPAFAITMIQTVNPSSPKKDDNQKQNQPTPQEKQPEKNKQYIFGQSNPNEQPPNEKSKEPLKPLTPMEKNYIFTNIRMIEAPRLYS